MEEGTPTVSAPATPGTPTPLFPSIRVDSMSYERKSMPRCKCLPIDAPSWGAPHTCFTDFPAPDISLTRKILGRALGGKVGPAVSGWDIGVRTVHFSSSSKLFNYLKMPTGLSLIECHRDEVLELPSKAEVIAWSDKTGIEMFRYGDHIMGVQGHPEYTKDILLHLIDRLLQRNLIQESVADVARANVEVHEPDREAWKKLCTSFLKGRLS